MKTIQNLASAALLALAAIFAVSCTKPVYQAEDNLRLRHKGADMPIWVRGNLESGKIVLFLHGGPGECAMCLREYFSRVEEEVAVAYWDQRIAGSASGNADPALLTYPQFAEDLEMAVRLLKQQYPAAKIFLLGHSFGVEMGWQFLTTGNNQDLVNGFIALDGTYSTYHWLQRVREWAIREARAQNDAEAEQYMSDLALTRDNMRSVVKWGEWYPRMFRLGANPVWPSGDKGYTWRQWFHSPHSKPSQMANTSRYDAYYAEEIFNFDRSALLGAVRIPVALFWGVKDGIIPIEVGQDTRLLLTAAPEVRWVEFENSWHAAFHTEQPKFNRELLDFVSTY